MNQTESFIITAVKQSRPVKINNTEVTVSGTNAAIQLHGSTVATINPFLPKGSLLITLEHAGWRTNTTKSRLNAVCEAYGLPRISQRKGEWFQGDEPFNYSACWVVYPDGRVERGAV